MRDGRDGSFPRSRSGPILRDAVLRRLLRMTLWVGRTSPGYQHDNVILRRPERPSRRMGRALEFHAVVSTREPIPSPQPSPHGRGGGVPVLRDRGITALAELKVALSSKRPDEEEPGPFTSPMGRGRSEAPGEGCPGPPYPREITSPLPNPLPMGEGADCACCGIADKRQAQDEARPYSANTRCEGKVISTIVP